MSRYELTQADRRRGGLAVVEKRPPAVCPRCGLSSAGHTWHSYLGHLGLHGLADAHFEGDVQAAQRRLKDNGLAVQDPFSANNAWPRYQPIGEGRQDDVED